MNSLQLSWKNIINKPLNLVLSLLLFGLGVGLITFLLLLNHQLDDQLRKNQAGVNMVVGAKGSPLQLVLSSMYHVDYPTGNISIDKAKAFLNPKHPLIERAVPLSQGDSYKGYRIVGTNHSIIDLYNAEPNEGKLWERLYEVTLGANVAKETDLRMGSRFKGAHGFTMNDDHIHDEADDFVVVGILKPTGSVIDQLVLTNAQTVWAVHEDHDHPEEEAAPGEEAHDHEGHDHEGHDHEGHDHEGHDHDHAGHDHDNTASITNLPLTDYLDKDITALLIKFKFNNAQTLNFPRNINENTELMAANPAYEIDRLFSLMGTGEQAMRMIALLIIVVSGISIFISLYASLRDRQYELALMRVMGASPGRLFGLIIIEGLVLASAGYLFGILLGHLSMEVMSGYLQQAYRYTFTGWLFLPEEGLLLAGALGIGFLAALIPAVVASNTDISDTLAERK